MAEENNNGENTQNVTKSSYLTTNSIKKAFGLGSVFFAGMVFIVVLARLGIADALEAGGVSIPLAVVTRLVEVEVTKESPDLCDVFDLKIISVDQKSENNFVIQGTYDNDEQLEESNIQLFVKSNGAEEYWPKNRAYMIFNDGLWTWTVDPGVGEGYSTLVISTIGDSGKSLVHHYDKVVDRTANDTKPYHIGFDSLTPDIQICDSRDAFE